MIRNDATVPNHPLRRVLARCAVPTLVVAALMSCAETLPSKTRNPRDDAAAAERSRCGPDLDETTLDPIFSHRAIESVEPLYARTNADHGGSTQHLEGAVIYIRAIQGMTAEWLGRALECHSARRVLGKTPDEAIKNDPFWLPGRMVAIEARAMGPGFRVAIRGATADDAQEGRR